MRKLCNSYPCCGSFAAQSNFEAVSILSKMSNSPSYQSRHMELLSVCYPYKIAQPCLQSRKLFFYSLLY
jgi:hypothetical protein